LAKAQAMTKDNDTTYEADFENGKVRMIACTGDSYELQMTH